jgi:hypothetical protein
MTERDARFVAQKYLAIRQSEIVTTVAKSADEIIIRIIHELNRPCTVNYRQLAIFQLLELWFFLDVLIP